MVRIVPAEAATATDDDRRDCEVATALIQSVMEEHTSLSPEQAYQALQQRLMPICRFPWNRMILHIETR
ncbi:MAG: hypothetical protein KDA85_22800 [Planctomycetaceae bacterium]|nr:hypothetical protein [Planctomycetaceae bacterium]